MAEQHVRHCEAKSRSVNSHANGVLTNRIRDEGSHRHSDALARGDSLRDGNAHRSGEQGVSFRTYHGVAFQ